MLCRARRQPPPLRAPLLEIRVEAVLPLFERLLDPNAYFGFWGDAAWRSFGIFRLGGAMKTHFEMGSRTAMRLAVMEALYILNGDPRPRKHLVARSGRHADIGSFVPSRRHDRGV